MRKNLTDKEREEAEQRKMAEKCKKVEDPKKVKQRKRAKHLIEVLLNRPQFNGNKLAAALEVLPITLSRRKRDGRLSPANFRALERLHRHYILQDFSDISKEDRLAIELAAVSAYRAELKTRINELSRSVPVDTLATLCKIIDEIQVSTEDKQNEENGGIPDVH